MSIREHSRKSVTLITGISLLFGDFFVPLQLMKRASYIFLIVLMLAACGGWRDGQRLLDRADSLLYGQPDSALRLLDSITEDDQERMSEAQLMRYHLLRLSAQNKCDTVFRSDSLQLVLTDYYDRRGSANEQMMAYYLLGRAYADMGEAPAALQAYQNAVDRADTTDCDFVVLNRVYGQMSNLFYSQHLYERELHSLRKAQFCALRAGDTITALINYGKESGAFVCLNRTDSAKFILKDVYSRLVARNRRDLASGFIILLNNIYLKEQAYEKMSSVFREYESYSGFFDSLGNVSPGRELYYYTKGSYFLGIHKYDSAIVLFNKCKDNGTSFANKYAGCKGLALTYNATGIKDSTVKYSLLAASFNDSIQLSTETESLQQMASLYDYTRLESENARSALLAEKESSRNTILFILVVFLLFAGLATIFMMRKRWNDDLSILNKKLEQLRNVRSELEQNLNTQEFRSQDIIMRKAEEIRNLQQQVVLSKRRLDRSWRVMILLRQIANDSGKKLKAVNEELSKISTDHLVLKQASIEQNLFDSPIVRQFRFYAEERDSFPTLDEWHQLGAHVGQYCPLFIPTLANKYGLSPSDIDFCMLVRLKFRPVEIAFLTQMKRSSVSTKHQRLCIRMTGEKDSTGNDFLRFLRDI